MSIGPKQAFSNGSPAMPARPVDENDVPFAMPLRYVAPTLLAATLKTLGNPPFDGRAGQTALCKALCLDLDEFLPIAKALHWLGLADLTATGISLAGAGRGFAHADDASRRKVFADAVLQYAGYIAAFHIALRTSPEHRAAEAVFRDLLEERMAADHAAETLRGAVEWGRYAGLFQFDEDARIFSLASTPADVGGAWR